MYLSCLTTSTIAVPCPDLIYSNTTNCCYTVTCQLKLSSGQPSRTISAIYTGSPTCPFNILEINGIPFVNPLATPIVLNQGQSITLVIESCPCSGVGNCYVGELYIDYTDVGGAGTEQIDFGLTEINPQALAYDPIPVALTAIDIYPCIGTSGCTDMIAGSVPFDNVSSFEVPLFIDDIGSNLPIGTAYYMDGVLQSGNTIIVPPKTAVTISFGFCWPNSTPTNFDIDFNVCDVYSRRITFNVEPVTCIDCGISCSDFEIKTENTYLPDFAAGCGFTLPNIYNEAAVGEKKTFLWTYVYADGFNNGNIEIFFNPYLFTNIDTIAPVDPYDLAIPSVGWYIKTYPYMIGTGFIDMVQKTNNQYQPSQQNELVRISIIDDYQFQIEFTFYMMMDIDNGMTNTYLENWKKLWFNNIYAVNNGDFITFGNDVYKATSANPRYFAQDFMLIDNSILVAPKKPKRCYFYDSFPIRARWYNKGLSVTTSEFSNPTFWFYRNSLPLATPSFSIFDNTEVEFWINIPSGATPNAMVAYVMDLNRFDNTIDWQSNYDFSRAEITTIGAPGIIDNNIESPSTGPTNIGGNVWKIRFNVGNQVRSTGSYAIGIIVYDTSNKLVNTFSYPDPTLGQSYIPVDLTPSEDALCCPLGKESVWEDYINTYVDKWPFATTYKQRLRHYLNLTGGQFASICLDDFGYAGLWTDLIVDVTLNIYQKRPLGNYGLNAHAFFMYYQLQSIKQAGYPDGYNNLSPMFTVQDLGGGNLRMTWEGRPRWESWSQLPLSNVLVSDDNTEYNRLPAGPVGTQYLNDFNISWDWSNPTVANWPGEIYLEYVIKFDLTYVLNLPNYTPFYVNKVILERLDVFKEEPNLPTAGTYYPVPQRFDPLLIEGWNGSAYITIVGPVCADQYEHIKVTFTSAGGTDTGTVVAFISKPPYGLAALKEDDDASISGTGFTQLDSQYIYDVSVGVQTGLWEFKIDVNALPADNYEICALFIPDI